MPKRSGSGCMKISELVKLVGGTVAEGSPDIDISGVAALRDALDVKQI